MRDRLFISSAQVIRRRFTGVADLNAALYASLVEQLARTGRLRTKPFDAAACPDATFADLSDDKVRWFLGLARRERQYPLRDDTPTPEALAHLNLLDDGRPSHAAVLLFGREPQRFLLTSEVKCMHFHGTDVRRPVPSYQIYKGTVFELVDQAVDFVMSKINRAVGTRARSSQAPVEYELPREAVTEAIVNAVAHRDYASHASVQISLFADRLEVWNPGELPPSLTIKQLRVPHASIPRNPLLAEPLFLARYAEKAGSGILDMIARCREAGLPPPQFRQEGGQFIQTLRRPKAITVPSVAPMASVPSTAWAQAFKMMLSPALRATGQVTGQVTEKILVYFREPKTGKELQDVLGLRHRETFLDNYLNPMLKTGLLERTVPGKPTSRLQQYRLTAKGRAWLARRTR